MNVNIPETAKKYFVNSAACAGSSISANPLHGLVETTADKALRQAKTKIKRREAERRNQSVSEKGNTTVVRTVG